MEPKKEAGVDAHIKLKQNLINRVHEFEDGEYDLLAMEEAIELRDKSLKKAVRWDIFEREKGVAFEDEEIPESELHKVVNGVNKRIYIRDTGLEPLNQMLTEFVNQKLSIDYLIPSYEFVKEMLAKIQADPGCTVYHQVVPEEGTSEYDNFIMSLIDRIRNRVQSVRNDNILQEITEQAKVDAIDEDEPSQSTWDDDEARHKRQQKLAEMERSFHNKLLAAKEEGELGTGEEEPAETVVDLLAAVDASDSDEETDVEELDDEEVTTQSGANVKNGTISRKKRHSESTLSGTVSPPPQSAKKIKSSAEEKDAAEGGSSICSPELSISEPEVIELSDSEVELLDETEQEANSASSGLELLDEEDADGTSQTEGTNRSWVVGGEQQENEPNKGYGDKPRPMPHVNGHGHVGENGETDGNCNNDCTEEENDNDEIEFLA